jgi:hypothetical protein
LPNQKVNGIAGVTFSRLDSTEAGFANFPQADMPRGLSLSSSGEGV